jgi:hypothetical protein
VHVIASSPSGDWTYGAAILSFAFPMILFIVVASALYVLYTKPHLVPGHRYNVVLRSVTDTAVAGTPGVPGTGERPGSGAEG